MRYKLLGVGDFVYYNGTPKIIPKKSYYSSSIKDAEKELECGKCYEIIEVAYNYADIEDNHWYFLKNRNWFSWVCFEHDNRFVMKKVYGLI